MVTKEQIDSVAHRLRRLVTRKLRNHRANLSIDEMDIRKWKSEAEDVLKALEEGKT